LTVPFVVVVGAFSFYGYFDLWWFVTGEVSIWPNAAEEIKGANYL
jgi:hypothetical protein